MLAKATHLPPLDTSAETQNTFRTPDHAASLFEGLAGAVTAWLEACVVIRDLLNQTQSNTSRKMPAILGFPGLGGIGARGLL